MVFKCSNIKLRMRIRTEGDLIIFYREGFSQNDEGLGNAGWQVYRYY